MTTLSIDEINERIHPAVAAYHAGDRQKAAQLCSEILAAMPTHPDALNMLAVISMDKGQLDQALKDFDHLVVLNPDYVDGINNRKACINRLVARGDSWLYIGYQYFLSGRLHLAIQTYQQAIAQGAVSEDLHGNMGAHYQDLGDWGAAEAQYKEALALNPAHTGSLFNYGTLLSLQHRQLEAEALLRRAIAVDINNHDAYLSLGHLLVQAGKLTEAFTCLDTAQRLAPQSPLAPIAKLFNAAYKPSVTASDMFALADLSASLIGNAVPSIDISQTTLHKPSDDREVLHIGFVSGDFKDHPVGYFTENLLRHADRTRFAWHVFSNFEGSDAVSARLRTLATSWTNIAGQNDEVAKTAIASKHIDVLFDLSGYTALNRLPLFASRAAPIQITWLGWHDTTGLRAMDYLLTDRASIPPVVRQDGSLYLSEKPLYLQHTRLCMMPPAEAPDVASQPLLKKGYITFGSMQVLAKLSSVSLKLWGRILHEVPTARLAIRTKQFREPEVMKGFGLTCAAHGLPMDRVDLQPPLGRGDYLASYADIDILLDSYPYPGGTTTAEALWMGVPTITMGGNTMISRQGVSLLTAAGLTDWIAASEDDYVAKAVYWANHPAELQALRSVLRGQVAGTALFDGAQFARDFEGALRQAQRERQALAVQS